VQTDGDTGPYPATNSLFGFSMQDLHDDEFTPCCAARQKPFPVQTLRTLLTRSLL